MARVDVGFFQLATELVKVCNQTDGLDRKRIQSRALTIAVVNEFDTRLCALQNELSGQETILERKGYGWNLDAEESKKPSQVVCNLRGSLSQFCKMGVDSGEEPVCDGTKLMFQYCRIIQESDGKMQDLFKKFIAKHNLGTQDQLQCNKVAFNMITKKVGSMKERFQQSVAKVFKNMGKYLQYVVHNNNPTELIKYSAMEDCPEGPREQQDFVAANKLNAHMSYDRWNYHYQNNPSADIRVQQPSSGSSPNGGNNSVMPQYIVDRLVHGEYNHGHHPESEDYVILRDQDAARQTGARSRLHDIHAFIDGLTSAEKGTIIAVVALLFISVLAIIVARVRKRAIQ